MDDDLATRERESLLARIEQQAEALAELRRESAELRARLYQRDKELREARAVLALVLSTRAYRLMRALGRWGWLEHRVRRVLR